MPDQQNTPPDRQVAMMGVAGVVFAGLAYVGIIVTTLAPHWDDAAFHKKATEALRARVGVPVAMRHDHLSKESGTASGAYILRKGDRPRRFYYANDRVVLEGERDFRP